MTGVIAHAGDLLDHPRHPRQRPQLGGETGRHRSFPQRPVHLAQIGLLQPRLASGSPGLAQGPGPALSPGLVPAMHADRAHFQLPRDLRLGQAARLEQSRRLLTPGFQAFEVPTRSVGLAPGTSLFRHTSAGGPNHYYIIRGSISVCWAHCTGRRSWNASEVDVALGSARRRKAEAPPMRRLLSQSGVSRRLHWKARRRATPSSAGAMILLPVRRPSRVW
jgi:hypothetical protein